MNKIGMMGGMGKRGMMMSRKGASPTRAPTSAPQAAPQFIPRVGATIADFIRSDPNLVIIFLALQLVNNVPLSQEQLEFIFAGNVPVILDSDVPPPIPASSITPFPISAPTRQPTNFPISAPIFSMTPAPTDVPTPQPTMPPIFGPTRERELAFEQNSPLRRNNLIEILGQPGDFTFFAPTNDAFRLIGRRVLVILFGQTDEYLPQLEDLVLFHAALGARNISSFTNNEIIPTFNGENISVRASGATITTTFNNARLFVERIDEQASNGVTQAVSGVFRPAWVENSIFDLVEDMGDLTILRELLVRSELDARLDRFEQRKGFAATLVAPTNSAFNNLAGTVDLVFLRDPANQAALVRILQYHIIIGVLTLDRIAQDFTRVFITLAPTNASTGPQREVVEGRVNGQTIDFNQAVTDSPDILLANNGAMYKIDQVLNPDSLRGF
jgi:uncharacterized surface protein with fasciclin (FAS1) repeats